MPRAIGPQMDNYPRGVRPQLALVRTTPVRGLGEASDTMADLRELGEFVERHRIEMAAEWARLKRLAAERAALGHGPIPGALVQSWNRAATSFTAVVHNFYDGLIAADAQWPGGDVPDWAEFHARVFVGPEGSPEPIGFFAVGSGDGDPEAAELDDADVAWPQPGVVPVVFDPWMFAIVVAGIAIVLGALSGVGWTWNRPETLAAETDAEYAKAYRLCVEQGRESCEQHVRRPDGDDDASDAIPGWLKPAATVLTLAAVAGGIIWIVKQLKPERRAEPAW